MTTAIHLGYLVMALQCEFETTNAWNSSLAYDRATLPTRSCGRPTRRGPTAAGASCSGSPTDRRLTRSSASSNDATGQRFLFDARNVGPEPLTAGGPRGQGRRAG